MQGLRHSRNILIQMAVAILLIIGLSFYFSDLLTMIYFTHQQTSAGYVLNGLILGLFLLGMIRILLLLATYNREEQALARFQTNMDQQRNDLLEFVAPASMIALRLGMLENMRMQKAAINHQALASTLVAHESTRAGLIRFIHNILILCGVLGTIISLSIALLGASTLLEQAVSSTGMGMVIHGMSTALSTTMTAVICYLFITYFYSALQNLQTRVLANIEQLTATRLLPMYQVTEEVVTNQALDLVTEAHLLVQSLNEKVNAIDLQSINESIDRTATQAQLQHEELLGQMRVLSSALKDGFRLPKE
ncbi:MAG: hypothetical protein R8K50_11205 [Mariprofundus sp.]